MSMLMVGGMVYQLGGGGRSPPGHAALRPLALDLCPPRLPCLCLWLCGHLRAAPRAEPLHWFGCPTGTRWPSPCRDRRASTDHELCACSGAPWSLNNVMANARNMNPMNLLIMMNMLSGLLW